MEFVDGKMDEWEAQGAYEILDKIKQVSRTRPEPVQTDQEKPSTQHGSEKENS
jgi:hypothetical protein